MHPIPRPRAACARVAALLAILVAAAACTPLIGAYSPRAYEFATSLKARTLALTAHAGDPYARHEAAAEQLAVDLQRAYEYARGVPRNGVSTRQWKLLVDPDGALLGRFLARWRREGTLDPAFVTESRRIFADAFDEIICLEANKRAAAACTGGAGA